MEKIEITTRNKRDGSLVPIDFDLGNDTVQIMNIGRQWDSDDGLHILVMDFNENTYHLFMQRSDLNWYLIRDIKTRGGSI